VITENLTKRDLPIVFLLPGPNVLAGLVGKLMTQCLGSTREAVAGMIQAQGFNALRCLHFGLAIRRPWALSAAATQKSLKLSGATHNRQRIGCDAGHNTSGSGGFSGGHGGFRMDLRNVR
jgi:hypothetical protein